MNPEFRPVDWSHSTNIYEVNLRQYTTEGTFNAFAKELPRLKDMGVCALWFMPVHPIGIVKRKGSLGSYYSIRDHSTVNPEHGTEEEFNKLCEAAHALGMKIIIDWVANHTSWDHVWTQEHPEFYTKDNQGNFRPPFADWEDVIDLDYEVAALREKMIETMISWVTRFDIDGFRCDMAHLVILDFWRQARIKVDAVKPLFWFAETEEMHYHEVFDATLTWEFLHKMEAFWRSETDLAGLESVLLKYQTLFPPTAMRVYFTSNHDENSHSRSEYERMGDAARAFAVFCATWNGIPMVYSGQELPNKKQLNFFEKDPIQWGDHCELHNFYKTLLHLHSNNPALRAADPSVELVRLKTTADDKIFAFQRKCGEREVVVILNLSWQNQLAFSFQANEVRGKFREIFSGQEKELSAGEPFILDAWQWLVYEK